MRPGESKDSRWPCGPMGSPFDRRVRRGLESAHAHAARFAAALSGSAPGGRGSHRASTRRCCGDAAFTRDGPRADNEYRDLGFRAASGRKDRREAHPRDPPVRAATGWHWHDMTAHFVYRPERLDHLPLRRRRRRRDREGRRVPVAAGRRPHNVIARSDDLELIEINLPAEYGTKTSWPGSPQRRP